MYIYTYTLYISVCTFVCVVCMNVIFTLVRGRWFVISIEEFVGGGKGRTKKKRRFRYQGGKVYENGPHAHPIHTHTLVKGRRGVG